MSEQPKSPESNTLSPTAGGGTWPMPELAAQALSYWIDSWQRTVLFWDVSDQRRVDDRTPHSTGAVAGFDFNNAWLGIRTDNS
jgi:hypothetical protein